MVDPLVWCMVITLYSGLFLVCELCFILTLFCMLGVFNPLLYLLVDKTGCVLI